MGRVLAGLAIGTLVCLAAAPARAQQGSVQLSAAAQGITGDRHRIGDQHRLEPDIGLSWLQPGARFGIFQLEVRASRRGERLHPGKTFLSLRDFEYRGIAWSVEAGDTFLSPAIGEYRFTNLFTPAVTFSGAAITGRTSRGSFSAIAGRTSAWRNIFGTDAQTLGQTVGLSRGTYRAASWLELTGRVSRVRTTDLKEFSYSIAASDQAGGGVTITVTPSVQVVADGSVVSYRRVGAAGTERDASAMAGVSWLHRRGWLQVNASRFSPGDFPVLNSPLPDRERFFAAGDYDLLPRVRVFAGVDVFRANLYPGRSASSGRPAPRGSGSREFGGVRIQLTSRSTVTLRGEWGARASRPVSNGPGSDSDTGAWSAEWHAAIGSLTAFARYAERENVERVNAAASYTQRDLSAQVFANLSRRAQIFATALMSRNEYTGAGGHTYWQAGGGGQFQVARRGLWVRSEGTVSRNVDLVTENFVPRESLGLGLNGQLSTRTGVALNVYIDRSPMPLLTGTPWVSRSLLRVTRTLPTGSAYVASGAAVSEAAAGRGTASVVGEVFSDWNGNGILDGPDAPLDGIPLRLGSANSTKTGSDGHFAFLNVPIGAREVGLDTAALPIDFDPPDIPLVELTLARGDTQRVSFGLVPLGTIQGVVIRDANRNGKPDAGEEAMDGAILVLDDGARSELARAGRYRFDAVRSGAHRVKLLLESLPEGAIITGDAEVPVILAKNRLSADVPFLVAVEKRPEIRRVFPPRGGRGAAPGASGANTSATRRAPARSSASPAGRPPSSSAGPYVIQIAAMADPANAEALLRSLKADGLPAYIQHPGPSDPSPYRIRVGPYGTRAAADKALAELQRQRGEKLWITRQR